MTQHPFSMIHSPGKWALKLVKQPRSFWTTHILVLTFQLSVNIKVYHSMEAFFSPLSFFFLAVLQDILVTCMILRIQGRKEPCLWVLRSQLWVASEVHWLGPIICRWPEATWSSALGTLGIFQDSYRKFWLDWNFGIQRTKETRGRAQQCPTYYKSITFNYSVGSKQRTVTWVTWVSFDSEQCLIRLGGASTRLFPIGSAWFGAS